MQLVSKYLSMEGELHDGNKNERLVPTEAIVEKDYTISIAEQLSSLFDESDEDEEPVDNTQD